MFGIKFTFNEEKAKSVTVANEDVVTAEEAGAIVDRYQDNMIGLLKEKFKFKPANNTKISVIHFEKDDPTNGHIQFLAAFSNLRAENYGIPTVDEQEIRRIAGNIIPAMITTTAAVVGHVGIEFTKLAFGFKEMEDFKQVFMNFALPMI